MKRPLDIVLSPKAGFKVAYHGPLDDRFAKANVDVKAKVKDNYAANAIDAILTGKAVVASRIDVKAGNTIAFPERGKAASGWARATM